MLRDPIDSAQLTDQLSVGPMCFGFPISLWIVEENIGRDPVPVQERILSVGLNAWPWHSEFLPISWGNSSGNMPIVGITFTDCHT
jgi:hypothetical protein